MRTRTLALIIAALIILSVVVAACGGSAPTATPVPAPTATQAPAAPTATKAPAAAPTSAGASAQAPAIPHDVAGRENCLQCHAANGVKPFPVATHANYTNQQCQTCHKPKS